MSKGKKLHRRMEAGQYLGKQREATGSNGKQQLGSLEAAQYLGKQREATGSNGKQQLGSLEAAQYLGWHLYTSPSPRDQRRVRMPPAA